MITKEEFGRAPPEVGYVVSGGGRVLQGDSVAKGIEEFGGAPLELCYEDIGGGVHQGDSEEKRGRTISFGQFPQDSKVGDIVTFLDGVVEEVKEEVEEVFAYGKKFAERGAVRSKTSEAMWEYMKAKAVEGGLPGSVSVGAGNQGPPVQSSKLEDASGGYETPHWRYCARPVGEQ